VQLLRSLCRINVQDQGRAGGELGNPKTPTRQRQRATRKPHGRPDRTVKDRSCRWSVISYVATPSSHSGCIGDPFLSQACGVEQLAPRSSCPSHPSKSAEGEAAGACAGVKARGTSSPGRRQHIEAVEGCRVLLKALRAGILHTARPTTSVGMQAHTRQQACLCRRTGTAWVKRQCQCLQLQAPGRPRGVSALVQFWYHGKSLERNSTMLCVWATEHVTRLHKHALLVQNSHTLSR